MSAREALYLSVAYAIISDLVDLGIDGVTFLMHECISLMIALDI